MRIYLLKIFIFFIRGCLYLLRYIKKIINSLYNSLYNFKSSLQLQKKYTIKSKEEIHSFLKFNTLGSVETLYFPKINNLSLGGELNTLTKGIQVYEFHQLCFSMNSDFLRFFDNSIYCDKITRVESVFNQFGDADFIKQSQSGISLKNYRKKIYIDHAFHLTGCFSKVWTHFLVQFFPKLEYLSLVNKNENINIILPNDIDPHIKKLIEHIIDKMPNISIFLVENDILVYCNKVTYVSIDTWLSDIAISPSMFHIQISDSTVNFILKQANSLSYDILQKNKICLDNHNKKLFIGRVGKRNIENYIEVLSYFESLGFIEIFPHLLTLKEKIELFSFAEYITGPASSGFANIIFCKEQPSVFVLTNFSRHDDMFLSKFVKKLGINYNTYFGKDRIPGYQDSDYYIDILDLKKNFNFDNIIN